MSGPTGMDSGQIEDRLAIRELIETSAIGVMRQDIGIWGGTWADEGSWTIPSLEIAAIGKTEVVAAFEKIIGKLAFVAMDAFSADLVIDGDTASGKAYAKEMIFPKEGGPRVLVGCFHDQYVRRNGRWYFLKREYERLWRSNLETA